VSDSYSVHFANGKSVGPAIAVFAFRNDADFFAEKVLTTAPEVIVKFNGSNLRVVKRKSHRALEQTIREADPARERVQ
jgi:hypothetical protein